MKEQSIAWVWLTRSIIVAALAGLGWFFLFSPWGSCNRNDEPAEVEFAKSDSTAQHKIDSLMECINRVNASNDSLVKGFTELEQSRYKILVNAKSEIKIAENKSVTYELYPQMRLWLNGERSRTITGATFPFDSLDVLSMAKKKIEYDWLKQDNGLLTDEVLNLNSQITNYKWQVSDYVKITQLKDEQIKKLENFKHQVPKTAKWKWEGLNALGNYELRIADFKDWKSGDVKVGAETGFSYMGGVIFNIMGGYDFTNTHGFLRSEIKARILE